MVPNTTYNILHIIFSRSCIRRAFNERSPTIAVKIVFFFLWNSLQNFKRSHPWWGKTHTHTPKSIMNGRHLALIKSQINIDYFFWQFFPIISGSNIFLNVVSLINVISLGSVQQCLPLPSFWDVFKGPQSIL